MTATSLLCLFFFGNRCSNLQLQNPIAMLNVLIACDHIISRSNLLRALSAPSPPCAVCLCADFYAAVSISEQQAPEIVIIDGSCDPLAAIEATRKITNCSSANVIAFSRATDADFARHMMEAGALGYLSGIASHEQVISAVTEVARDNFYNCIDSTPLPLPTPSRIPPFIQSIASFGKNTREKMRAATDIHWHGILKFTN